MVEFKSACEMMKLVSEYRLDEAMMCIKDNIEACAKDGGWYTVIDIFDMQNEYQLSAEDTSFIFNKLTRAGYIVEEEHCLWTVRWDL